MTVRIAVAAAMIFVVVGCVRNPPILETIDPGKATAVDLILLGGATSYCVHGNAPQLKAIVTLDTGKRLETWTSGTRAGKVGFDQFEWSSSYGVVDGQGQLRVPRDPFAAIGRDVTIRVVVVDRPDLTNEITISPSFACGGLANYSGANGQAGNSAYSGQQGRSGSSGNSTSQATDGEHGGDGGDGGHAGNGGPGPQVSVVVGYIDTEAHGRLVLVKTAGGGGEWSTFVFDPAGRQFAVAAWGGGGGPGGDGGNGGSGGSGGSNNVVDAGDGGHGGDGGSGGNGGIGGDGGDGGSIEMWYDERFPELRDLVVLDTSGGQGGRAGSGGFAGSGGSGGSSASGRRGNAGRVGVAGQSGASGRAGRDGPPAARIPAAVTDLFPDEISRGIAVVR